MKPLFSCMGTLWHQGYIEGGVFHWFSAYFYTLLGFYNRNGFNGGRELGKPPKCAYLLCHKNCHNHYHYAYANASMNADHCYNVCSAQMMLCLNSLGWTLEHLEREQNSAVLLLKAKRHSNIKYINISKEMHTSIIDTRFVYNKVYMKMLNKTQINWT